MMFLIESGKNLRKKLGFYTLGVTIGLFMAFIFGISLASADILQDFDEPGYAGQENINPIGMYWTPSGDADNLYRVQVNKIETATTTVTDLQIYVCKGEPDTDPTDYASSYACGASGNQLIHYYNCTDCFGTSTALQEDVYITFPSRVELDQGSKYYISFYETTNNTAWGYSGNQEGYLGHDPDLSHTWSMAHFETWYSDDIYYEPEVIIYSEEHALRMGTSSWLVVPPTKLCYLGETCYLDIKYSQSAIGGDVYLFNNGETSKPDTISSSTLTHTYNLEHTFTVGTCTVTGTVHYDVYLEATSTERIYDTKILCLTTPSLEWCNDDPCEDISASSTVIYEWQCGLNKFGHWLVCPDVNAIIEFNNALALLEGQFPFSIYYQILDISYDYTQASTTTGSLTFYEDLDGDGTTTGIDLIPANFIAGTQIDSTWQEIRSFIIVVMWLFLALYMFLTIRRLTHK